MTTAFVTTPCVEMVAKLSGGKANGTGSAIGLRVHSRGLRAASAYLAATGEHPHVVAALGNDEFSALAMTQLGRQFKYWTTSSNAGPCQGAVFVSGQPAPICRQNALPVGPRSVVRALSQGGPQPQRVMIEMNSPADVAVAHVVIDHYARSATEVWLSFASGVRLDETISRLIPRADWAHMAAETLEAWSDEPDTIHGLEFLQRKGARSVLLSHGDCGATVWHDGEYAQQAGYAVRGPASDVSDAAMLGTLAAALDARFVFDRALRLAMVASAWSREGRAMPGNWEELEAWAQSAWEQRPIGRLPRRLRVSSAALEPVEIGAMIWPSVKFTLATGTAAVVSALIAWVARRNG